MLLSPLTQPSSLLGSHVAGVVMVSANGSLFSKGTLAIDAGPPRTLQSGQSQQRSSINISRCSKMAFPLHFCLMTLSQRFPTAILKNKQHHQHHQQHRQAQDLPRQLQSQSRDQQNIMSLLLLQCPLKLRQNWMKTMLSMESWLQLIRPLWN